MPVSVGLNRDMQVSFSIQEVKNAIDVVCTKSKKFYQIKDKNDILNTYSLWLLGGAVSVSLSVQLRKVSDTETNILLQSNKVSQAPDVAIKIIDNFLGLVSRALGGEVIDENVVAAGKSGCLGVLIFLVGFGAGLLYFLL